MDFYRKSNGNENYGIYTKPQIQKLTHWRNIRIRYGKYWNWKQTTLYLCFLDIILKLPSLPTHSLRAKVCLETRGFAKFWKFRVFSIGNPTVMEINGKWGYFQENLVKHLAMIPVGLRHCYCGELPHGRGTLRSPDLWGWPHALSSTWTEQPVWLSLVGASHAG